MTVVQRAVVFLVGSGAGLAHAGSVPFVDGADGAVEVALGYVSRVEGQEYLVVVRDDDGRPHVIEARIRYGIVDPARLGHRTIIRGTVQRKENERPRLEIETVDHAHPTEFAALLALRKRGLLDCDQDTEGRVTRIAFHPENDDRDGIAHLAKFERLENLSLANVTDANLLELAPLRNVEFVSIDSEYVTGAGLVGFANCENLHVVNAWLPKLNDDGLRPLTANENLWCLRVNESSITNDGLRHIGKLEHLRILEVNDTKVGDAGLKHLEGLTELEYLFLAGTPITDDALAMIPELRKLWALKLERTAVTDEGLSNFLEFESLKGVNFLYLADTKITDAGLAHLVDIEELEGIDLAGDGITDAGLTHLETHEALKWIHAPGCPITDAAATKFGTDRPAGFYITRDRKDD